jgi:hypothetical protein
MLRDKLPPPPADDILALQALAAVAACADLGPRFLALSGLDTNGLRARAADPALLAEVIAFLAAHEASLIRIADQLKVAPAALAAAGQRLSGERLAR